MGGEEFAILMPEANADAAYEMAERVRAAIARVPIERDRLTCSAGVVSASVAHASPADLLDLADKALYEAKRSGRDRTATSRGARRATTKVA
jgi:diguanylate cyclase (GGDEF)-like protein